MAVPAKRPYLDCGAQFLLVALALFLASPVSLPAAQINPPIGPHVSPGTNELAQAKNFGTNSPVVLTSYFYWYDIYSNAHIVDHDGSDALTDHPPTLTGFSYKSAQWHKTQLQDMIAAGVDVLLPVYWGEPSQRVAGAPTLQQPWSFSGLPPLVEARQALLDAREKPPAIGLFYDTSTLQYNSAGQRIDLTTDYGRRWFYETIRDFFSLIPARHWATIEGRPIIFLYAAGFAAAHDQTCIDYVRQEFARDFSGRQPYIVREISWSVTADNTYAWGGALSLRNPGVGALGPGYDHSAVPGREPLIVPREDGAFFERNWTRFLRAPSKLVHVETWNEYHEGTDIAASREYGRKYIDLNRKYADMFKAGIKPPRPRGPFSDFKSVSVTLQATNDARGLAQLESADGITTPVEVGGKSCRATVPTQYDGRYIYFQIHESFKWADKMLVEVEVEYFDQGSGTFHIQYDGSDPNAPFNGAYTSSKTSITLGNSGQWKTARFRLLDSRFLNSQNAGADFRIALDGTLATLYVRKVTVSRLGMPSEAGAILRGWQHDFAQPLGTNWLTRGDASAFHQADGVLSAGPARGGSALLLTTGVHSGTTPFELLARVRPVSPASTPNWLGGVSLVSDPDTTAGYSALFRPDSDGATGFGLISSGDSFGPFAPVPWQTNRWHWLKLKHETNALSNYPDLWARLWPADGETPEPVAWTAWRDYFPASNPLVGFAGIMAGQGRLDLDWLLLKADGLPEITARPPEFKPALITLAAMSVSAPGGLRFSLTGDANTGYFLQSTSDFISWEESVLLTDLNGAATFQPPVGPLFSFFRARLAQ